MSAPLAVADQRSPQGFGPVCTLSPDWLTYESRGALGGGIREQVPVAAIMGFYVAVTRFVQVGSGTETARDERFLVAWQTPQGVRRVTWVLDVASPAFQGLLAQLALLRPHASLLGLPSAEAHRRLGMTSLAKVYVITIAATLAVVLLGIPLVLLLLLR